MKVRKLLAMVSTVAFALTSVGANYVMQKAYAEDKEVVTTEAEETVDVPRIGDLIWITDEKVMYQTPDKMFDANISSKIQYEIYIVDRYNDEYWRVHVPFLNEPERVLLIPVEGYNIEVISHDNYVVGDLTGDQRIDAFDMVLLRRALFRDYNLYDYSDIDALIERSIDRQLADVNSDSEISVADLVCMTNFILGRAETFRWSSKQNKPKLQNAMRVYFFYLFYVLNYGIKIIVKMGV